MPRVVLSPSVPGHELVMSATMSPGIAAMSPGAAGVAIAAGVAAPGR